MAITIPDNPKQIFDRIAQDIKALLNDLDPFLLASLIEVFASSLSVADFELYKTLQLTENSNIWDTTSGDELIRWAAIFKFIKLSETKADGFVTFTGTPTTLIPINTSFTSSSGEFYKTTSASTIITQNISVTSLTRSGTLVTVITSAQHGLATGQSIDILGAIETEYNGLQTVTVIGLNSFTYLISTTPTTPATGVIVVNGNYVNVASESIDFGADQNLINGSTISLSSPIAGVDTNGLVSFDEIAGGADVESDEGLRDRWLERVQNPISPFNEQDIINTSKTVPGVTRVFVQTPNSKDDSVVITSITRDGQFATVTFPSNHSLFTGQKIDVSGADQNEYNGISKDIIRINDTQLGYIVSGTPTTPATGTITVDFSVTTVGSVRVFFVRDNDTSIFPSASEIQDVKDVLLTKKPATIPESSVIVDSPVGLPVDFTFTSITPDSTDMRNAITDNLALFFAQGVTVAEDINQIDYESVINGTFDSGGNPLVSFILSTPTGDIPVASNELPVLGIVSF